ncbi:MAG: hypothetical protein WDZ68_00855 [Candidatus Paceibacterota bacterium]
MTVIISGGLLIVFFALFHFESRRGERIILARFRNFLDQVVEYVFNQFNRIAVYVGSGSFRIIIHFYIHTFLNRILSFVEKLQGFVHRLQQRNSNVVKSVREMQENTHLEIVAEHKALNTLSDSERQQIKERALEGK